VDFLGLLPGDRPCAFEFRHPSWLDEEILTLLRKKGASLCTADSDENPANEIIATAPWGYLRLRRSDYTDADLSQWIERILSQKWKKAFVFFKHEEEDAGRGPEMAVRFRGLVDSRVQEMKPREGEGAMIRFSIPGSSHGVSRLLRSFFIAVAEMSDSRASCHPETSVFENSSLATMMAFIELGQPE